MSLRKYRSVEEMPSAGWRTRWIPTISAWGAICLRRRCASPAAGFRPVFIDTVPSARHGRAAGSVGAQRTERSARLSDDNEPDAHGVEPIAA